MTQATKAEGIDNRGLRATLLLAAAIEAITALTDLSILFDVSDVVGPGLGGAIITASIPLRAVAAVLALVFAVRGNIRAALLAMAAIILLAWASLLPSVAIHGLEFEGSAIVVLHMLFEIIVAPVIALVVIMLALHNERLCLATGLAVLPTAVTIAGFIAFAIGVGIYGF